jgi:hypothetical protein
MTEAVFEEKIKAEFESWCSECAISTILSDEEETLEFMRDLFEKFLNVDESAVENIYKRKTNSELVALFVENYNGDSIIDFILYVIHLIFEEDYTLFASKLICTGSHYGHWGTHHFKPSRISGILSERYFDDERAKNTSDYYKRRWVLGTSNTNTKSPNSVLNKALEHSFLALFGAGAIKLVTHAWESKDSVSQIMLTLGTTQGSIKLYGFCLEKAKLSPTLQSLYEPVSINKLNIEVRNTIQRAKKYAIPYFRKFIGTSDREVINIIYRNPPLIWYHFQLFLWLITQPFSNNETIDSVCEQFFPRINNYNTDKQRQLFKQTKSDCLILNRESTNILSKTKGAIHRSNISIFNQIISICQYGDY